ncbi:MAG: hypothetical protein ACJ790_04095 [Myxococcaceae bacterium]
MRRALLVGAALLLACGSKSTPDVVPDAGDAGCVETIAPPYSTYTYQQRSCARCEIGSLLADAVDASFTNCGHTYSYRRDAGWDEAAACVRDHLDGGSPFFLIEDVAGIDSETSYGFVWTDGGVIRMFDRSTSVDPRSCGAFASSSFCSSLRDEDGYFSCVSPTGYAAACDERRSLTVSDRGERPLSELRCDYPFCRTDSSQGGFVPDGGQHLVCTDAENGFLYCQSDAPRCPQPSPAPSVTPVDAG